MLLASAAARDARMSSTLGAGAVSPHPTTDATGAALSLLHSCWRLVCEGTVSFNRMKN